MHTPTGSEYPGRGEGGREGGREGGKEGKREAGREEVRKWGREAGREGGRLKAVCDCATYNAFEIDVMGSQRSGNFEGLAMQIHHWVQKVRCQQLYISKVILCHSISIIGTSEQQLWCHWCQGRAQDKGKRNPFLANFSLFILNHHQWRQMARLYQKLLKVLPAN